MDLLPKVETDFIEELPEPLKEEQESDTEENVVMEVKDDIIPEVEKKQSIPEEDIFVEKKVKKELSVEPVKKPAKKKRQMTEEQLERLRIGREKGLAKRRAAAAEKKEMKELQKKKKQLEMDRLREEVGEKPKSKPKSAPVPTPAPAPAPEPQKTFRFEDIPQEMLVELQKKAIEGYDTQRKARKAKKKEEESKQSEVNHFRSMVTNAVKPKQPARYGEPGFFNHLF
jgi:hypothetical protein